MMETKNTPKSEASRKTIWSSLSWMFLKLDLGFVPGLAFQNWVSRNILLTTVLSKGMSTEGRVVIVVINVRKGTLWSFWFLGDFLLVHDSCHFSGIAVNSSHQDMAVRPDWGAIISVLHWRLCYWSSILPGPTPLSWISWTYHVNSKQPVPPLNIVFS